VELEANPAMVEEIERKVREKLVSDAEALEKAAPTEASDDMDEE
jgi:recombination protein RecA